MSLVNHVSQVVCSGVEVFCVLEMCVCVCVCVCVFVCMSECVKRNANIVRMCVCMCVFVCE